MKKSVKLVILILGILLVLLVFLFVVLVKKDTPAAKKEKAEKTLSEYGIKFYGYYYDQIKEANQGDAKSIMSAYKDTGLTITVKDLKVFLDTHKEEDYSMFDECNLEQTKVTIIPTDPYEKDNYDVSVILDCKF